MSENKFSLKEILSVVRKNLAKVITLTILFVILSYIFSEFVLVPKYTASVSMIINNKEENVDKLSESEINVNKKLVTTYSDILKTRGVVNQVISTLELNTDYEKLKDKMSVESENNNEIFTLKIEDTNPERAADTANQTANVFKDAIKKIMNLNNVQILDEAIVPQEKSSPSTILNMVIAGALTFVTSLLFFVLREFLDTSFKDAEDVTTLFDIPVLGLIPDRKKFK